MYTKIASLLEENIGLMLSNEIFTRGLCPKKISGNVFFKITLFGIEYFNPHEAPFKT